MKFLISGWSKYNINCEGEMELKSGKIPLGGLL